MSSPAVLLITKDLMLQSRVSGAAQGAGVRCDVSPTLQAARGRWATAADASPGATGSGSNTAADPVYRTIFLEIAEAPDLLRDFIEQVAQPHSVRVIAFGSHVATAWLEQARTAGAVEVLARGQFLNDLSAHLKRGILSAQGEGH